MKGTVKKSKWMRLSDDRGQALPLMFFLTVLFLGFAGLTLDVGNAYFSYRDLQATTDAAALAGALAMTQAGATTASVTAVVNDYSSLPKAKNANLNLGSVVVTPVLSCVPTSNYVIIGCTASPTGSNVIRVTQTANVPTLFIRALSLFGVHGASSVNLGTTATASLVGSNVQANVAIILDTTRSMKDKDSDPACNDTKIHCALNGVQALVTSLTPCTATTSGKNCNAFDQVALFTYPNVRADTAKNSTGCPSSDPTILDYSTPAAPQPGDTKWTAPTGTSPTYQLTTYLNDYSSTYAQGGALNPASPLAIATGGSGDSKCTGMSAVGGKGTYFAGAINAAQASLMAAKAANDGSQNYMVILSDGDADSSDITGAKSNGTNYGSSLGQCQQAIAAAQNAMTLGTTVYTVAYGASNSGCASDVKVGAMAGLSPCTTMKYMSGDQNGNWPANQKYFFSDSTSSSNKNQCPSANSVGNGGLNAIFSGIGASLSKARLVPNSVSGTS